MRKIMLGAIFLGLCALAAVFTVMLFSIYDAKSKANAEHMAVGVCLEGYAVVSFAHGGSWSFSQVFEKDGSGRLVPVHCGRGPFGHQHWRGKGGQIHER